MKDNISLIGAAAENNAIGYRGLIPWHISADFQYFKRITMGHPVIMGLATWRSFNGRPLPGRRTLVVSDQPVTEADRASGAEFFSSPDEALAAAAGAREIFIIGGGMSYTFINAMGHEIGDSIFEPDMVDNAKEILATAEKRGVKLYLPVDYVIANDYREDADKKTTQSPDIPAGWQGMDIGPKTTQMFAAVINSSKTILWNGPVGVFEWDTFAKGTCTIALCVSSATIAGAYSLIGGGDSIAAVNKAHFADHISYISTGGGAMLEYLEGIELPGIKALNDNE